MGKNRIALWDNIKGLLIILVVFGHFLLSYEGSPIISDFLKFIYIFHMPAFIFISGYFGTKKIEAKNTAKLIFAYFFFNSIMSIFYGSGSLLIPLYSFWFIPALLIWRLTADKVDNIKYSLFFTIVIGLSIGFIPEIDNTLGFSRFIAFYPFYLAGYKYKLSGKNIKNEVQFPQKIIYLLTGLLASLLIITRIGITIDDTMMFSYEDPSAIIKRIAIYATALCIIVGLISLLPNKKIPFLTVIGRNSLSIFLIHRYITLVFADIIEKYFPSAVAYFTASLVITLFISYLLGNDYISGHVNRFLSRGADILLNCKDYLFKDRYYILTGLAALIVFTSLILNTLFSSFYVSDNNTSLTTYSQSFPVILDSETKAKFDNAYRIVFSGDLILLEDQVKRGLQADGTYNFDDIFDNARSYINSADFAIGVFEGPMAGDDYNYSEGNFDDGKEIYLNFPLAFGQSVRDAGFDLVTTAGNHILDREEEGNLLTLNNLDKIGLNHTGSYCSQEDKDNNNVFYIEQNGISFAVLSYTYGINHYDTEDIVHSNLSYCTSFIYGTEGDLFEELREKVSNDFAKAKSLNADFIVVLPHYGTQFSNEPDEMQLTWNAIFKDLGADIILGDHSHVIQPVTLSSDETGKKVFEAFCPGNFANIYRDNQGDTSALIEVYIDRETKEIIGGGIVPLYTQSPLNGNYRAIPIYDIENNTDVRNTLSTDDYNRAREANRIITENIFGYKIDISGVQPSYLFDERGYLRPLTEGLNLTNDMRQGTLWPLLESNNSICFLGDSVTEGTKNNGCPWYEPILPYLTEKSIYNFSLGGCNVQYLIDNINSIPSSDLYVIAIGTNDVRYRGDITGASTSDEYIDKIDNLISLLLVKNTEAEFVLIAPWYSSDGDYITTLSYQEKLDLNEEYSNALYEYCLNNAYSYINVNPELESFLNTHITSDYMIDYIHPNSTRGVILYSELVLSSNI